MPSAHIHPQRFKAALHDAIDIGKEAGTSPAFPYVAVTLSEAGVQGYGRSHYAVGWSFSESPLTADDTNTVLIEFDEAKELGMAVGKTSAAKDASVWVEINAGRLTVDYGNESIADLPSVEPEPGDIESINEELALLDQAEATERSYFAMGLETIKRFTKVRSKAAYIDLFFTDIGNTTFVKIGDNFIGGFEAIDRPSAQDPKLFTE